MAAQKQVLESWAIASGMDRGVLGHAANSLVKEGLIRRSGRGGGKASIHWNAEEFAYFMLALAAIKTGFAITSSGHVSSLLYQAELKNPFGMPGALPILSGSNLGEGLASALNKAASGNKHESLQIAFYTPAPSYLRVMVTSKDFPADEDLFGKYGVGTQFYYAKNSDGLSIAGRETPPLELDSSVSFKWSHIEFFSQLLADSLSKTGQQVSVSDLGTEPQAETKDAASFGEEAASPDDPENPLADEPRTQDRALNKPGHYARARSQARRDSGLKGTFRPLRRSQPHVEHHASGSG